MRITGGVFRSRAVRAPRGDATRPTSDRVREALFSMLSAEHSLDGARVLDLYAGSGALAFEALSRGAAHATLVEKNKSALAAIAGNVDTLGVRELVAVRAVDVERAANFLRGERFDLIFADPPYRDVPSGAVARAIESIALAGIFADDARLVLEHASRDEPPIFASLELKKQRTYGDTAIAIFGIAG